MESFITCTKILLVDDDIHILEMMQTVLQKERFHNIYTAQSGEEAIGVCQEVKPDIIVLDVMLPDYDGFLLCQELRKQTQVPILFLTAKTTDLDKLTGFGFGGDDYITKPFNPLEVVARIKAHLRRQKLIHQHKPEKKGFDYGRFRVIEESGELLVEGSQISCPAREFKLLVFLCKHPNQIISKKQLYKQVWEETFGEDCTVMVHIRRLREKIEPDPSNPQYLVTVRGLGYKLINPSCKENEE